MARTFIDPAVGLAIGTQRLLGMDELRERLAAAEAMFQGMIFPVHCVCWIGDVHLGRRYRIKQE